jgi:hypothetical protein
MSQYAPLFGGWDCLSGDVAQLGERLVRNEEVGGSIPLISTRTPARRRDAPGFLGRARRGASGALHPQSAIAELNSRPRPPCRRAGPGYGDVEGQVRRNRDL